MARGRLLPGNRPRRSIHKQPRHHHQHAHTTTRRRLDNTGNTRLHRRRNLHSGTTNHRNPKRHPRPPRPRPRTPPRPRQRGKQPVLPPSPTNTPLHRLPHHLFADLCLPPLARPTPPRQRSRAKPPLALRPGNLPHRRRLRRRLQFNPHRRQRRLGRRELWHKLGHLGHDSRRGRYPVGRHIRIRVSERSGWYECGREGCR